jgi:hypothetical protein
MFIALCAICVTLMPNTIRTEYAHESHISQHFNSTPFADNHNWGVNLTGIIVHWDTPGHTYLELGESYRVQGWAPGPKETTTLRVGVQWQLK